MKSQGIDARVCLTVVIMLLIAMASDIVHGDDSHVDEEERALVANLVAAVERPMSAVDLAEAADAIPSPAGCKLAVTRLAHVWKHDSNSTVRGRAAQAMALFPDQAKSTVPLLIEGLHDRNEALRESAAWALCELGPSARTAVPALTAALKGEYMLRVAAVTALGQIGPAARSAVPALVKLIGDDEVAGETIRTLGQIGPDASSAVDSLIRQYQTASADRRAMLAETLGDIGPKAGAAVPLLTQYKRDADPLVAVTAQYALAQIDPRNHTLDEVAPTLALLSTDDSFDIRLRAIEMLGKLKAAADECISALVAALDDESATVRVASCQALGQIGPAAMAATDQLELALQDQNVQVRKSARLALQSIRN